MSQKHREHHKAQPTGYCGLLSRRLRKWAEKVVDVWRRHEVYFKERLLGRQLELFQNLLELKKEADKQHNRNRLQLICSKCASEMGLLFIAYLEEMGWLNSSDRVDTVFVSSCCFS